MSKIKLLNIETMQDGTMRLQSQLLVGRSDADFIFQDGILKHWGRGENGFSFYPYQKPYEIVSNKKDMRIQQL